MSSLFLKYSAIRTRQYLFDSKHLYLRFFIVFILIFGFVFGDDKPLIQSLLAQFFSSEGWAGIDLVVFFMFYLVAFSSLWMTRKALCGGSVHSLLQSWPISARWERGIRAITLNLINAPILFTLYLGVSLHPLSPADNLQRILSLIVFYCTLLCFQLLLAEGRWGRAILTFGISFFLLFTRSSITGPVSFIIALTFSLVLLSRHSPGESPSLVLTNTRRRRSLGSYLVSHIPSLYLMQCSYILRNQKIPFYMLTGSILILSALGMVLKQKIGLTQKTYVFAVATGLVGFFPTTLLKNFHILRESYTPWMRQLPRSSRWWTLNDFAFTSFIYLLVTFTASSIFWAMGYIPFPLAAIILPLQCLRFLTLRNITRSRSTTWTFTDIYLSLFWFVALGWIAVQALALKD